MTIDLERELTTGFAAHLIRQKAKQLIRRPEFAKSDQPDLEQELSLRVIEAFPKFDPEVAHWNAFVTTIVERNVASILEFETAEKRCSEEGIESLNTLVTDSDGNLVQRAQTIGTSCWPGSAMSGLTVSLNANRSNTCAMSTC